MLTLCAAGHGEQERQQWCVHCVVADARTVLGALEVREVKFLSRPNEPLLEARAYAFDKQALASWRRLKEK